MNKSLLIAFIIFQHFNGFLSDMYNNSHWLGTPVHLECGALTRVDCSWRYNDKTMNIGNRYGYLFSNGSNTTDCSIVIRLFHEEDVGNWTCWSLSTDKFEGDLLATYTLNIKLKQRNGFMRSSPGSVVSQIGWYVLLPCKFNIYLEECHWLRNGQPVAIVNRYKFVNYLASGSDCSMNITSVQNIDIGTWQCATSANNAYGYVISRVGQLTVSGKNGADKVLKVGNNTIVEHPENSTVRIGETLALRCKFRESVKCVWLRKEQAIHVGYRYGYISKESNSSTMTDCSLSISNSQMIDQGLWRCVGAGDDRYPAIFSDKVFISLIRDDVSAAIAIPPVDIIAPYDNNVTLSCKFNSTVNCDWSREGMSVKISGRYSYVTVDGGKNTTDCSLEIRFVSEVDVGNWSCTSMLNYTNSYVENARVSLSLLKVPYPVKILLGNIELPNMGLSRVEDSPEANALEVVCISEYGNPAPGLSWHSKNVKDVQGNYEFELVDKHLYTAKLRSRLASLPRGIEIDLTCRMDFPNVTDSETTLLVIGKFEKKPLEIIEGPKSVILPTANSAPMNLTCKFNQAVNCTWKHNNTILSNEQHYTYADGSKGLNTADCTITINATLEMMGSWQCFITSESDKIRFTKALLSLMAKPSLPSIRYYDIDVINTSIVIRPNLLRLHLYCNSHNGNPAPKLRWELDGKQVKHYSYSIQYDSIQNLQSTEISIEVEQSLLANDVTEMKCILEHPSYSEPQIAKVKLIKNRRPLDPIMAVNDTLVKSNIVVRTNSSTAINCVSQSGSPAANMFWKLDGKEIAGFEETLTSRSNLSTVILHWPENFNWSSYSKPLMTLRCVADHPEYDEPRVAQAVVTFVVNKESKVEKPRDLIRLKNEDTALEAGSTFIFMCQYDEDMTCGMKQNDVLVDDLRFVPSFSWFEDESHTREVPSSQITLHRFSAKDVGLWQCSCLIHSDNVVVDSKGIRLSLTSPPSRPEIRRNNKAVNEIMLKHLEEIPDLTCTARRGNPGASLSWWLDGFEVKGRQEVINLGNASFSTVLYWNSTMALMPMSNTTVLQCIARHPKYDAKYHVAEVIVTLEKAPDDPVILFYQRAVVDQPINISVSDLGGLKCVCANGNPVAALTWQVNAWPIPAIFVEHVVKPGLYTAELQWNPKNNQYLVRGPLLMVCIASHPSFHNNRKAVLRIILQNPDRPAIIRQPESSSHKYWAGIAISALLLLSVVVAAIIYSRYRHRSPTGESESIISNIQRRFSSWLRRSRYTAEEPLIQYSNLDEDQGGCEATINCNDNE